jgi:RNA polymerase sigma-54 factor
MALELRQSLKLAQQLVMTPQLQQAIKLLQLSRLELATTIQQEMEQNPLLEEELSQSQEQDDPGETGGPEEVGLNGTVEAAEPAESEFTGEIRLEEPSSLQEINWQDYANEYESLPTTSRLGEDPDAPSSLDILTRKPDLNSHLQWQLRLSGLSDEEQEVGNFIIGNLNRDGFLETDLNGITAEMGCSEEMGLKMLAVVQDMDPPGIGAANLKESLLLQLDRLGLGDSLAAEIVRHHLGLLEHHNYAGIVRATKATPQEVEAANQVIINLDPFPGRQYADEEPQYIIPDVYVYKMDGEYVIMINDEGLPRLRISNFYRDVLRGDRQVPAATKDYIQDKMRSAAWLIKSIQQRQRTIYRVVESIIKFQRDFFERGIEYLKPLVLRDVAQDIEMHESTISRVTSNKYVHTPQGIFELKYFFTSSIEREDGGDSMSSLAIKNRLKAIVADENPAKPLSDNDIADIFKKDDIRLARRTVAKYREQLGILPSKLRRKAKF